MATSERRRAQNRKKSQAYRERHPERVSAWFEANRDRTKEAARQYNAKKGRRYRRHGVDATGLRRMWDEQDGCCYLCGRAIDPVKSHIEHWHGCTAGHLQDQSCDVCRRGLACPRCNTVLAQVNDDTDLLRKIAAALDVVQAGVLARRNAQMLLF